MKAYCQVDESGEFFNVNAYVAFTGFRELGFEVGKFFQVEEIEDSDPEVVVVGGISNVRKRLDLLGIEREQREIEYPEELQAYLGRRVWSSSLREVIQDESARNIFVKPKETKLFEGRVIREFRDLIGLNYDREVEVWCSEPVAFVTEWRCFIRYGELWDARYYKGLLDSRLDVERVQQAAAEFRSGPAAYSLDFGATAEGECLLVEVNDGHSIGSYGTPGIRYAKFLSARWAEMTGTRDYLR